MEGRSAGVLHLCNMILSTWFPLISGYTDKKKKKMKIMFTILKAMNQVELIWQEIRVETPTGFPQALSTLLHAIFSTPQCSEQAICRYIPVQWEPEDRAVLG